MPLTKRGVSHLTFCFSNPEMYYQEEIAWAGDRYVKKGNWVMYGAYTEVEKTVDLERTEAVVLAIRQALPRSRPRFMAA